jgi:hypothetical protein
MSRLPTFDETYSNLHKVCQVAQRGIFDLGRCREAYDEKELTHLVLNVSKAILNSLPCLQLDHDAIEQADSRYGHILSTLENAEVLECTDQAIAGHCDECLEPCDIKEAK